jgi:hypothetical protein
MLASMIEILSPDLFRPHLGSISAHVTWLEEHVLEEALASGAMLRGWRSNHLPPEGGPLGWCTAQALRCASRLHELTRSLLCADVLADLGGTRAQPADASAWARLLDSDLLPTGGGGARSEGAVLGAVDSDLLPTGGGGARSEGAVLGAVDSDLLPTGGGGARSEGAVLGAVSGAVSGSTLKTTLEQRMIEPLAALSACDPLGRVLPPLKCLKVGTAL